MGPPIHKVLEEFPSEDAAPPDAVVFRLRPRSDAKPQQPPNNATQLGEAFGKGFEEGQRALRAEFEAQMASLKRDCEQRLSATRVQIADKLAGEIATQLREQLETLQDRIEANLVDVLSPVLRHVLTERAVTDLAREMRRLIDKETLSVDISGPDELTELICRKYHELDPEAAAVALRRRQGVSTEVHIEIDGTVIESRIMQWIGRIAEVTG